MGKKKGKRGNSEGTSSAQESQQPQQPQQQQPQRPQQPQQQRPQGPQQQPQRPQLPQQLQPERQPQQWRQQPPQQPQWRQQPPQQPQWPQQPPQQPQWPQQPPQPPQQWRQQPQQQPQRPQQPQPHQQQPGTAQRQQRGKPPKQRGPIQQTQQRPQQPQQPQGPQQQPQRPQLPQQLQPERPQQSQHQPGTAQQQRKPPKQRGPIQQQTQQGPQQPQQQHELKQQLEQHGAIQQPQKTPLSPERSGQTAPQSKQYSGKGGQQTSGGETSRSTISPPHHPSSKGETSIKPQELIPYSQTLVEPGTKGRKILIEVNHVALSLGKTLNAVHYDVSIVPDTPKGLLRNAMVVFGKKHYPERYPAFDGRKNLYSSTKLPFGDTLSDTIKVCGENGEKEFVIEVKFARFVDLSPLHDLIKTKVSPQDALQCIDIVLRNAPANNLIIAGRSFFTPPKDQIIPLGDGMEMYYGFYQSAIRGWKPLLNIDVAHKAFPTSQEVLDLICELGSDYRMQMTKDQLNRSIPDYLSTKVEKFMRQLKVKYEIPQQPSSKRIYRVNGLGGPPSKVQFTTDDGKTITVEKYFATMKNIRLKYPHLPTLWVGALQRQNKILLPIEFCTVIGGQAVNRKMTENQTSNMIKKAATSTDVRKQKIMDALNTANFNNDPCIREFGLTVNDKFERLDARVLRPPTLVYRDNFSITPARGVWRADRAKFFTGAIVKTWTITSVTRGQVRMERLAESIYEMAPSSGIQMEAKAVVPFQPVRGRQSIQDIVEYFKTKQNFDLIFVVVPNSGPQYSFVKQAAELNVGCLTQCIKEKTLFKLNNQTVANILLKVNSKLNGTNHGFAPPSKPLILKRPCMIMGADVTHPSPDAKDIPSVAAVTASHDPQAFQYNICWRLQSPKTEIIEDLCNITIEQLKFFYIKTNVKPEKIIFFRDGVSEGQFQQVRNSEIRAIQRACKLLQPEGYEPPITFLVVQKRHHTRLFPTNPRDSEDKNNNVPAGTCVDTVITNPTMQDFYLVSHASIQGVAKPTKYCTIWDDNHLSHDVIQELAYHLCHMFARCNRSVSYPAPTYYAHLAAARAKVYIENSRLDMTNLAAAQTRYQIMDSIRKDKPMFFV